MLFFTVLQETHHRAECDITTKGALKAAFYSTSLIIVNIPQMNTKSIFSRVALLTLRTLVVCWGYCLHAHCIIIIIIL